jgi:hypothetical protein
VLILRDGMADGCRKKQNQVHVMRIRRIGNYRICENFESSARQLLRLIWQANSAMQTVTPIDKPLTLPARRTYFRQSVLVSSSIWGLSEHYQASDMGICALSTDRLCAYVQTITFRIKVSAAAFTLLREVAHDMIASVIVGPHVCGGDGLCLQQPQVSGA